MSQVAMQMLSISIFRPSLCRANATVRTASRCACRQNAGSTPHSQAEPGGQDTGSGHRRRPALIPAAGAKAVAAPCLLLNDFSQLAEMVPPNPGLRAGARRMVRPVLGSVDHATPRADPAFGTFASAETPKRSIPSLADPQSTVGYHIYIGYQCRCGIFAGWNSRQMAPAPETTLPRGSSKRRS